MDDATFQLFREEILDDFSKMTSEEIRAHFAKYGFTSDTKSEESKEQQPVKEPIDIRNIKRLQKRTERRVGATRSPFCKVASKRLAPKAKVASTRMTTSRKKRAGVASSAK